MPGQYQYVTRAADARARTGASPSTSRRRSRREIFTNNIRVAFLAFAGGILLGLGTLYVLIKNGLMLGATFGLAVGVGNGPPFFELVLAHGVLELSCIAVAGAAGLRIGWAHHRSRELATALALRCAKSRAPRSRSCSARCAGSSWPASSRASSPRRAERSATVLVVGFGLGVVVLGRRLLAGARVSTPGRDRATLQARPALEP